MYFLNLKISRVDLKTIETRKRTMMEIPEIDDFHVHLRQGKLMEAVTPLLKESGVRLAYVMVLSLP